MRRGAEREHVAAAELAAVLAELGIETENAEPDADLALPGGILVEVKSASRPTPPRLQRLGIFESTPSSTAQILVADRLDPLTRRALEDAGWGWLDRSGHLRVMAGSVQIDRTIESLTGPEPTPPAPLARPTGLAVALELLSSTGDDSLRSLARRAAVSLGAAHATITQLKESGLLEDNRRRDPDLFWAVASHWRVRWFPLASGPLPGIHEATRRLLRMRLDDPAAPGWAEVGDVAARAHGARVAGDAAARLYVPDQRALTWALRTWGEAGDPTAATAFLAVAPTLNATTRREDASTGSEWPVARPIVVALQLASDGSSRSREILAAWDVEEMGLARVW